MPINQLLPSCFIEIQVRIAFDSLPVLEKQMKERHSPYDVQNEKKDCRNHEIIRANAPASTEDDNPRHGFYSPEITDKLINIQP